jgi:cell division protease FtsH
LSSTRQANHHCVHHAGNSAGDPPNRVFERHRVDVAVEIAPAGRPSPGTPATLYGQNVPLALTEQDVHLALERTDGSTASFLKELIRCSVLEALHDDPALTAVTGAHPARALDDPLGTPRR